MEALPKGKRRKFWFIFTLVVVVLIVFVLVWYKIDSSLEQNKLNALITKVEAEDPNWLAFQTPHPIDFPDKQNNAHILNMLLRHMANRPVPDSSLWPELDSTPALPLSPASLEAILERLKVWDDLEKLSNGLAQLPTGYFPEADRKNIKLLNYSNTRAQNFRGIASLLQARAITLASQVKPDEALETCIAMLHTAHAVGQGRGILSGLICLSIENVAMKTIEYTLSQTTPSEATLKRLQEKLGSVLTFPMYSNSVRGERAFTFLFSQELQDSKYTLAELTKIFKGSVGGNWWRELGQEISIWWQFRHTAVVPQQRRSLELFQEYLDAGKLPLRERERTLRTMRDRIFQSSDGLIHYFFPALDKAGEAEMRAHVYCKTLMAAIACERYRLQRNRWPTKLEELVPQFLPAVPEDDYGTQLLLKAEESGIIVYSIHRDRKDDKGDVHDVGGRPATDLGIKLWNLKTRKKQNGFYEKQKKALEATEPKE